MNAKGRIQTGKGKEPRKITPNKRNRRKAYTNNTLFPDINNSALN